MTIHLEVFRSKSIKLSPVGLCQSRLINCWDATLRGNSPHRPGAHAHLARSSRKGMAGDAGAPAHSRRSPPSPLRNTS